MDVATNKKCMLLFWQEGLINVHSMRKRAREIVGPLNALAVKKIKSLK